MTDYTAAHVLAQEGLRHIESAILMLLDTHPIGPAQLTDRRCAGTAFVHP